MDPSFESRLLEAGVGEDVVKVLNKQKVLSLRIFRAMKEDHIVRLLQCSGMPVGGHALLWELWERDSAHSPRVTREYNLTRTMLSIFGERERSNGRQTEAGPVFVNTEYLLLSCK